MVPHAGTDTRVWREVVELGAVLRRARRGGRDRGAAPRSRVLFDWEAWWACELDRHPTQPTSTYLDRPQALHARAVAAGRHRRRRPPEARPRPATGWSSCPTLYLVDRRRRAADVARATSTAAGTVLVTYFCGIVDEHDHVRLGGYPGAFRDLLGVRIEEFSPLPARASGAARRRGRRLRADVWTEELHLTGAEAVCDLRRRPAVARCAG